MVVVVLSLSPAKVVVEVVGLSPAKVEVMILRPAEVVVEVVGLRPAMVGLRPAKVVEVVGLFRLRLHPHLVGFRLRLFRLRLLLCLSPAKVVEVVGLQSPVVQGPVVQGPVDAGTCVLTAATKPLHPPDGPWVRGTCATVWALALVFGA